MEKRKILFVDDEIEMLDEYLDIMTSHGYEVKTAESGNKAWEIFQKSIFLVVITDLKLSDGDGLAVLENIKKLHPATQVIIVTAYGEKEDAIKALRLNAADYVEKGSENTIPYLLHAIEKAFTQAEMQIKIEKEMLSILTHTLRNTLCGGPQTVEQVLRISQNVLGDRYQEGPVYKTINNIASLHSIFTSVNNMLETYKFYVSEPGKINQRWKDDIEGNVDLKDLFFLVLKQTIGRILFEEQNLAQFRHLREMKNDHSIKEIRESFINGILLLEESQQDLDRVLKWLKEYFPVILMKINKEKLCFNTNGIRFNILFSCISEIVYNALKYTGTEEQIQIGWQKQGKNFIFSCRNSFSVSVETKSGTQKGLSFIKGLMNMIDGSYFSYESKDSTFVAKLCFEENLLKGGNKNEILMD
jgi:CheY-like chemotaxis protein